MKWIDLFLLLIMLFAGWYCAWKDLKSNIVPNKIVLPALLCALAIQSIAAFLFDSLGLTYWLGNLVIGSVIAIVMYIGGFWAAGDVKFFIMLFSCVPITFVEDNYNECIIIFILVFSISFLYLVADTILMGVKHKEKFKSENKVRLSQIVDIILLSIEITVLQSLANWMAPDFCADNPTLIAAIGIIASVFYYEKGLVRNIFFISIHIIALIIILLIQGFHIGPFNWKIYIIITMMVLFRNIASQYNYIRIPTKEIQKGMILSSATVFSFKISRIKNLPSNPTEDINARITEEEAEAVRRWATSVHGQETVVIIRKIPFAVFIISGYTIWMIIKAVNLFL